MANERPVRRLYDLAYGRAGDKGNIANVRILDLNCSVDGF